MNKQAFRVRFLPPPPPKKKKQKQKQKQKLDVLANVVHKLFNKCKR